MRQALGSAFVLCLRTSPQALVHRAYTTARPSSSPRLLLRSRRSPDSLCLTGSLLARSTLHFASGLTDYPAPHARPSAPSCLRRPTASPPISFLSPGLPLPPLPTCPWPSLYLPLPGLADSSRPVLQHRGVGPGPSRRLSTRPLRLPGPLRVQVDVGFDDFGSYSIPHQGRRAGTTRYGSYWHCWMARR